MKIDLLDILDMRLEEIYNLIRSNCLSVVELELKKIGIEEDISVLERYKKHYEAATRTIDKIMNERVSNDNETEE
jgi:hypothetical protein